MLQSSGRLDFAKVKILVVDDNQQSLDLMMQVLSGFRAKEIRTSTSTLEAKSALAIARYDLVIIDGEMPDGDGFDLTRQLRLAHDHPNSTAPVILVSAHTSIHKVKRARDSGANLVVKKPIAPAVLLSRLVWLANNTRQFIVSDNYCGPDRRMKNGPPPEGVSERRASAIALTSVPDRALSQDDVDSLFG